MPTADPFETELQRRTPAATPAPAPTQQPNPFDAEIDRRSPTGTSIFGTQLPRPQLVQGPLGFGRSFMGSVNMIENSLLMNQRAEVSAIAKSLVSGRPFEEVLAEEEAKDEDFRQRFPKLSFAEEMGGGLATGGAGTARVLGTKLVQAGGRLRKGAAIVGSGTTAGAIAGAGTGTDTDSRLTGAMIGSGLGATLGIAIPASKAAVTAAINRFTRGTEKGQIRFAARKIQQALDRDELTPEEAFRRIQELGPEAKLVDVGENVRGLGRSVAGQPGRGKKVAVDVLEARQEGQGVRLTEAVNEALDPTGDFAGSARVLQEVRKEAAAPLYKTAYETPIKPNERLVSLFRRPALEQAWNRAKKIAANEGEILPDELFIVRPDGGKVVNPDAIRDVKTLDFIKRGLDDIVDRNTDAITGKIKGEVAKGVNNLRKQYIAVLDGLSPEYKAARAAWSGPSRSLDMMNKGRRFINADEEITAGQLLKMTGDEKFFFRMGAARQLRDTIFNTPDGTNAVRRIFGSELKRQRLRAVFPDNASFKAFRETMEQETELFRTRAIVSPRSGSQTDLRAAERSDLAEDFGGVVSDLARGNQGNAAARFLRKIGIGSDQMTPDQALTLTKALFTNDTATNRRIINALSLARQLSQAGNVAVGAATVEGARQGATVFSPGQ